MFTRTAVVGVLVVGVVACADDGVPPRAGPSTTAPAATELAPSQVVASTVATPTGVPPCDVADLELTSSADSVIIIRNSGSVECEVDVSRSPNRDPSMEPSVWLMPGGQAELAVVADGTDCAAPMSVEAVDLVVNGEPVAAPVSVPASCSVTLIAFYTAE